MNATARDGSPPQWSAITASVRGSSHERSGKPNQDSVRVQQVTGPIPGLIASVCDGHGGDRYVRSDIGSLYGVEVACEVGRLALTDLGDSPAAEQIVDRLSGHFATQIVSEWTRRVNDHVSANPFTAAERQVAGPSLDGAPTVAYGATLLMAVFGPTWVGLLQIGDGDVITVTGDRVDSPVPGDTRLVANETTSLCLPLAAADSRCSAIVGELPSLVTMTSDGYANSFASPTWRTDTALDMLKQVESKGLDGVETRLPGWLNDSATAGGDDVSMALVVRPAALRPPDSPPLSGPSTQLGTSSNTDQAADTIAVATLELDHDAAQSKAASSGDNGQTRHVERSKPGLVIAAIVALLMAAAIGLLVGMVMFGSEDPSAARPGAASSTSTPQIAQTTSTIRSTTTSLLEVGSADEVAMMLGERSFVMAFDPSNPSASNPRVVASIAPVFGAQPELPAGWRLEGGTLLHTINGSEPQVFDASSVGTTGRIERRSEARIWVLAPDGISLTGYSSSGENLGMSQLQSAAVDSVKQDGN